MNDDRFDKHLDLKPVRTPAPVTISVGDAILYLVIGLVLTFYFKEPIERAVGSVADRPIAQAVKALGLE